MRNASGVSPFTLPVVGHFVLSDGRGAERGTGSGHGITLLILFVSTALPLALSASYAFTLAGTVHPALNTFPTPTARGPTTRRGLRPAPHCHRAPVRRLVNRVVGS